MNDDKIFQKNRRKDGKMKKKILALFTAAALMAAGVPAGVMAEGDGSKEVKINYSCSSNKGFQVVDEQLSVKNDLAETILKKTYPEVTAEEADGVTVLDVLVAAHVKKYGDAFMTNPSNYMKVSQSSYGGSYVSEIFKDSTGNQAYVNNAGIMNVSQDTVNNGDVVKSAVSDPSDSAWTSKFTYFEKETYNTVAGKKVKMALKAIGYDDNYNPVVENAPAYTLKRINKNALTMKDLNGSVNSDSTAVISFNNPGINYVTAIETKANTMFAPIAKVTVGLDKAKITKAKAKGKKAVLKWKKVTGAKKYEVYKGTKKKGKFKKVATVKKTTYTDKKVKKSKKNKNYFYKVRAIAKADGKIVKGKFSKTVRIKIKKAR